MDERSLKKPWYKSKTMWFGILTVMGAAAGGVMGALPILQSLLTVQTYSIVLFIVGVINIVLRAITEHGISLFKD